MINEKAKQQAIINAYGEYWDEVKSQVDENGFIDIFKLPPILFDSVINDGSSKWRPKSLTGIENNNGWIKIESENDLPKEPYGKYEVYSNNPIFSQIPKIQGIDDFWQNDENKKQDWMNSYTYYKPIILSKPPIY